MQTTRLAALTALAALGLAPTAQAQQRQTVTVAVSELRSTEGQLIVCVFATRDRVIR